MKDLFVSELCIECRRDSSCDLTQICVNGCCVRPNPSELNTNEEVKDPFVTQLSKQEDFDFVYVGKSGKSGSKSSKHECNNHKDCRSSEKCVYSRSRGYRVCKRKSSGKSCQRNGDCKSNERCTDAGYCVYDEYRNRSYGPRSGKKCKKRSDCGSHRSCSGGYCVRRDLDLEEVMEEE